MKREVLMLMVVSVVGPVVAAEDSGAKAFARHCAQCHGDGPEAVGTLQLARTRGKDKGLLVGRKDLPPEYVRVIARMGLKAMPSFTPGALPDAELDAIAVYVTR